MSVHISSPAPKDIPLLGRIMSEAFDPRFGEAWTAAQLAGAMNVADTWALLGYSNGEAFGFALTRRIVDEAELMLVAVLPAKRGNGFGRRLVEAAMQSARQRGACKMFLEVRDGNVAAFRLYESLGFTVAGQRQNYYTGAQGERFDAITMHRNLV